MPDPWELNLDAPQNGATPPEPKVYRVGEITRRIKETLEDAFGAVWIGGEISNLRRPASGHLYFTLKDAEAQISAVLFRGAQTGLRFQPADGMQVRVFGEVTVYERGGNYQVLIRKMEQAGRGALQEAFEKLKSKLAAEGLFDAGRKKPLPLLPRRIGVVTSPTGAAIRDMLNILTRRFPNLHILVVPVRVQGKGAAEEIAAGIDYLNAAGLVDVIIIGRGGGSLEDLWAFNEEVVARAIARSGIPLISAVGHEIDFTISDFVADLRAPTPSAAAELAVQPKAAFEETLDHARRRLARALQSRLLNLRNRFLKAEHSYVFREPRTIIRQHRQRLEAIQLQRRHAVQSLLNRRRQELDEWTLRQNHASARRRENWHQRLDRLQAQLRALSPFAVLERGFSITRLPNGGILKDPAAAPPGTELDTRLARGSLRSRVL